MRYLPLRARVVLIAALVLTGPISTAQSALTSIGPIQIAIPEGFESAKSGSQDSAKISAWTKGSGSNGTLLQVSIVDLGSPTKSGTPAELAQGAEKYLRQFLEGVERRRADYTVSPIRRLSIAGLPAASATWTGKVNGLSTIGVMYCVIVQARYVVSLHTQAPGGAPTPWMRQAMRSFEGAQVRAN